jgi:ribosomal-protein-alanine N-acetyltransferase
VRTDSLDHPITRIDGRQVYLVPFGEEHLSDPRYYIWLSDIEVMRFIGREEYLRPIPFEDVRAYVEELWRSDYSSFFAIHYASTGVFIGTAKINFVNDAGMATRTADLGIMIGDKALWGKGVATDTLYALARYAFNTLAARKLTAGGLAANEAVLKAFRRIGFVEEGRIRGKCLVAGEYMDHVLLGCFCDELVPPSRL